MWTCPKCSRNFASPNQHHMCTDTTLDDLLEGKSDSLILAFDKVLISVIDWEPCSVGASTKSAVFTKSKAWLIVRPMAKELDLKFYYPSRIESPYVRKVAPYRNKYAHHVRISDEAEVTPDLISLLRKGWKAYP